MDQKTLWNVYNCQADQPTNYGHQTATFECGTPSSGHLQRSLAHHSSRNTCKQSTTECNLDTIEEDQDRRKGQGLVWGAEFIQFLVAFAVLHWTIWIIGCARMIWKKRMNKPTLQIILRKIACLARKLINSAPPQQRRPLPLLLWDYSCTLGSSQLAKASPFPMWFPQVLYFNCTDVHCPGTCGRAGRLASWRCWFKVSQ